MALIVNLSEPHSKELVKLLGAGKQKTKGLNFHPVDLFTGLVGVTVHGLLRLLEKLIGKSMPIAILVLWLIWMLWFQAR